EFRVHLHGDVAMSPPTKSSLSWPRLLRAVIGLAVLTNLLFSYGVPFIARAQGRDQTVAEKAFEEGEILFKQGSAESLRAAVLKYEEALDNWRAASNKHGEVKALLGIASAYYRLDEHEKALDYYNRAFSLSRAAGDLSGEA